MSNLIKPSVNIYVLNGTKLLLSKRVNTGWMDGFFCAPGGHAEKGETPTIAMQREIKEELGVDVLREDLEFLCVAARKSTSEYVAYEFIIRDKKYNFNNAELNKCSELIWADINNLPDNLINDFRQIIERSVIGNEKYLELGY